MASFSVYNDDTYDNMYINTINTHSVNGTGVNLIGDINVDGNLASNTINGTTALTNLTSTGNFQAQSGVGVIGPTVIDGLTVSGNSFLASGVGRQLGFFNVGPVNQQPLPPLVPDPFPIDTSTPLRTGINDLKAALQAYGLLG